MTHWFWDSVEFDLHRLVLHIPNVNVAVVASRGQDTTGQWMVAEHIGLLIMTCRTGPAVSSIISYSLCSYIVHVHGNGVK